MERLDVKNMKTYLRWERVRQFFEARAGSDDHRKPLTEMMGEFFREASVLVVVFGLLDKWMRENEHFTCQYVVGILSVAILCMIFGILIERARYTGGNDQ